MRLIADLHLHSHYSRATSRNLTLEHLWKWAQLKGVQVVATGDVAHPGWLAEIRRKLEPAEAGLFRLRPQFADALAAEVPASCRGTVRFLIGGEISNIYKKHGRTRKVHNIVFCPSLETTANLQAALEKIGNIRSDGRPILGLDSRDLLEIVLAADDRCQLIPAHIWTPWFSILGSRSGFDSVEECFADLTPHVFAVETGLSSDPPMNWRVSWLDRYTLISSSDAHSPPKLAREATAFDTELSYDALFGALAGGAADGYRGTIEFFPEEGKYHLDGHRKCGVRWEPATTIACGARCPACGKAVTVGVSHRTEELADRPHGARPDSAGPFARLIPLPEALAEMLGAGPNSKRVQAEYLRLLQRLGPELTILQDAPPEELAAAGDALLAEGVRRMRAGEVRTQGGYDGEYGVIRLFDGEADRASAFQLGMFAGETPARAGPEDADPARAGPAVTDPAPVPGPPAPGGAAGREASAGNGAVRAAGDRDLGDRAAAAGRTDAWIAALNPLQRAAVLRIGGPLAIVAGPGTGKTRTLTARIAYLIEHLRAPPASVLALTFTNTAARELRGRLAELLGGGRSDGVTAGTFHQLGAAVLREFGAAAGIDGSFAIADDRDRQELLKRSAPGLSAAGVRRALAAISAGKNLLTAPQETRTPDLAEIEDRYHAALAAAGALDLDDLIFRTVRLLEAEPGVLRTLQARFRWISVDEYQDVNAAQHRLLRLLAAGGANLCVIGDPNQAIYGFRGADHRYFLSFADDFPGARQLRLDRNYRSPQTILDAAAQVIARGPGHGDAALTADLAEPSAAPVKVDVHCAPTGRAEAEFVVHQVERLMGGTSYFSLDSGRVADDQAAEHLAFGDFAVLYRLNAQAEPLQEAFDRSGIPYQITGGAAAADDRPVREVLSLLWLTLTPGSALHRRRVVHGASARANARGEAAVTDLVARLRAAAGTDAPTPVAERVRAAAAGWADLPGAAGDGAEQDRIAGLQRAAGPFGCRLRDFLTAMALESETDRYDRRADRVTLMSLHASKGLEFPVVFIVGCEDGLLPYRTPHRDADAAEERRLFYVGMTRARRRLILTHAARRLLFGRTVERRLSGFVRDIETALRAASAAAHRRPAESAGGRQLPLPLFRDAR